MLCVHRIPLPTSVTIASRPSSQVRDSEVVDLIWGLGEAKYFLKQDWTGQISLNCFNKFRYARKRLRPAG
jgi:hypothetical protein